jgi:chromosome segregation ATPase
MEVETMHPSDEEVKLVEKIKFWEEQEKINSVLVDRLFQLNTDITSLLATQEIFQKKLGDQSSQVEKWSQQTVRLTQAISQYTAEMENITKELIGLRKLTSEQREGLEDIYQDLRMRKTENEMAKIQLEEVLKDIHQIRQLQKDDINQINEQIDKRMIDVNESMHLISDQITTLQKGKGRKSHGKGISTVHVTITLSILAILLSVYSLVG